MQALTRGSVLLLLCVSNALACASHPVAGAEYDPEPEAGPVPAKPSVPAGTGGPAGRGDPMDVAALFAPPTSDVVTPGSIFGVWASSLGTTSEFRMKVTPESVTLAARCKADGVIAYVTARARASEARITVLESKTERLNRETTPKTSCSFVLSLEVGEWVTCNGDAADACWLIEANKLRGLETVFWRNGTPDTWLKLAD